MATELHDTARGPDAAAEEFEVAIVIPCLNEVDTVGACVSKAVETLRSLKLRGEVIVVDNGSTDGSAAVAERCGARVVREARRGYGNAVMRGIEEARAPFVILADSDGSHDLGELPLFIARLRDGANLVMGSRLKGSIESGAMPLFNRMGNLFFVALVRILFGRGVSDVNCGMRGFTIDAYRRMDVHAPGFEFCPEMVVKAIRNHLRIDEVSITHHPAGRNRPPHLRPMRDGWRHLKLILRLFALRGENDCLKNAPAAGAGKGPAGWL